jgi:hypothetical protein
MNRSVNLAGSDPNSFDYGLNAVQLLDKYVAWSGLDPTDLVFPDGWTELHSIFLYQRQPLMHQWLMKKGLIPTDTVAQRFPPPIMYRLYPEFPKQP